MLVGTIAYERQILLLTLESDTRYNIRVKKIGWIDVPMSFNMAELDVWRLFW